MQLPGQLLKPNSEKKKKNPVMEISGNGNFLPQNNLINLS